MIHGYPQLCFSLISECQRDITIFYKKQMGNELKWPWLQYIKPTVDSKTDALVNSELNILRNRNLICTFNRPSEKIKFILDWFIRQFKVEKCSHHKTEKKHIFFIESESPIWIFENSDFQNSTSYDLWPSEHGIDHWSFLIAVSVYHCQCSTRNCPVN